MDILYIHILQIIIKCDWTLNEAIHGGLDGGGGGPEFGIQ